MDSQNTNKQETVRERTRRLARESYYRNIESRRAYMREYSHSNYNPNKRAYYNIRRRLMNDMPVRRSTIDKHGFDVSDVHPSLIIDDCFKHKLVVHT